MSDIAVLVAEEVIQANITEETISAVIEEKVVRTTILEEIGEILTGTIDGKNVDFTTKYNYYPGTVKIFVRGIRQTPGANKAYLEMGDNKIRFSEAPRPGDDLVADYIKL